MKREWFEEWFDTPFYPILYKNRDEREAEAFIKRLVDHLKPQKEALMLDLACGRGRHALFLSQLGYFVTGLDLSYKNVTYAQELGNENLNFYRHDMRQTFRINYFDYVFNFFSSFGYFQREKDHNKVIRNVAKGLRSGGFFVLDFLNVEKGIKNMLAQEQKEVEGIYFELNRRVEHDFIIKDIRFSYEGENYHFVEKIRTFGLDDFEYLMKKNGLKIESVFGDYGLSPYDPVHSDRLIVIARKLKQT